MAPNNSTTATECTIPSETAQLPPSKEYKVEIVWRNVILFSYLHLAALYGLYLLIFSVQWKTFAFNKKFLESSFSTSLTNSRTSFGGCRGRILVMSGSDESLLIFILYTDSATAMQEQHRGNTSDVSTTEWFQVTQRLPTLTDIYENVVHSVETNEKASIKTQRRWWNDSVVIRDQYQESISGVTFNKTAVLYVCTCFGITAGAHRLWSHKTYKARLPFQILLAILDTMAFQNSIYEWSRDHRLHHKYSETDADPHNAKRGFFFAHMGWLLCRKHPQVMEKGKGIDMSDLKQDPLVMFQHKYYFILMPVSCFLFPTLVPVYFWNETLSNAWFVPTVFRYVWCLHITWLVNSAAHLYGTKPYDKNINPAQNLGVSIGALGEGWHNYHHVFPWDYKAAELGNYKSNFTTMVLDGMAKIGMAYDLKTVPEHMVKSRVRRTGDGTHPWGWGDKEIPEAERKDATILYSKPDSWGWDDEDLPEDERTEAERHFKRD